MNYEDMLREFDTRVSEVRFFITTFLQSRDKRLREEVEKLRRPFETTDEQACGYDLALSDVLALLDKEI